MGLKGLMLKLVGLAKQLPLLGKIMLVVALGSLPMVVYPPIEKPILKSYEYNSIIEKDGELRFYLEGRMLDQDEIPDSYCNDDAVPMVGDKVIFIKLKNYDERIFVAKERRRVSFQTYADAIEDTLRNERRGKSLAVFALSLSTCLASFPSVRKLLMYFVSKMLGRVK